MLPNYKPKDWPKSQSLFKKVMKFKTLIVTAAVLLVSSCKINGSFQGLYGYYNKTKLRGPELFINHTNISNCNLNEITSNKIVITTGELLKSCIHQDKTIIYMWSPKCRSKFCYDLNLLQQLCNQKKINLLIVAEYYDFKSMTTEYYLKNPIFGIDTEYYKTNLTSKYSALFYEDLINQKTVVHRLLYFEKGVYKDSYTTINEIN